MQCLGSLREVGYLDRNRRECHVRMATEEMVSPEAEKRNIKACGQSPEARRGTGRGFPSEHPEETSLLMP